MSSSVIFLLGLIALSIVGVFVLWIRERGPRSMDATILAFKREREALAPESTPEWARPRPSHHTRGPRPG